MNKLRLVRKNGWIAEAQKIMRSNDDTKKRIRTIKMAERIYINIMDRTFTVGSSKEQCASISREYAQSAMIWAEAFHSVTLLNELRDYDNLLEVVCRKVIQWADTIFPYKGYKAERWNQIQHKKPCSGL
jgi:hypothetical protein